MKIQHVGDKYVVLADDGTTQLGEYLTEAEARTALNEAVVRTENPENAQVPADAGTKNKQDDGTQTTNIGASQSDKIDGEDLEEGDSLAADKPGGLQTGHYEDSKICHDCKTLITTENVSTNPDICRGCKDKGARTSNVGGFPMKIQGERDIVEATLIEQVAGKEGREWDVVLIQSGASQNGTYYPAKTLENAAKLFENVYAYADHGDGKNKNGRSIRDKVGKFDNIEFGQFKISGRLVEGLKARFRVISPWLREMLLESVAAGIPDFIGFSIDAVGKVEPKEIGGRKVRCVESINKVSSVDVVAEPAAGGQLVRLVASKDVEALTMTPEELRALITSVVAEANKPLLEQVQSLQGNAKPKPAVRTPEPEESDADKRFSLLERKVEEYDLKDRVRESISRLDQALSAATTLSELGKTRIRKDFLELLERRDFEDDELVARIKETQAYEAALVGDLVPLGSGPKTPAKMGQNHTDQFERALEGWFEGKPIDGVKPFRTLKEAYCIWTGKNYLDVNPMEMFYDFTGRYDSSVDHQKIRESVTTASWANVFADNLYVLMQKEYRNNPLYDQWRKFCSEVENVPDFQTRHWVRTGGYGDLTTVPEQGTYPPLTSFSDEEISYSIAKRGGLDDATIEMLTYERGNLKIRNIPKGMARSAARTLYKYVMNFITTDNPTMSYDSVALYSDVSGTRLEDNSASVALSISALNAAQVTMRKFTAFGETNELLGERNRIKYLIVPPDLEQRAVRIINPSTHYNYGLANGATAVDVDTSMDPEAFKGRGIEITVYDQLSAVSTSAWYAVADPKEVNTMVMGFWNGQEEPELFVQDNALVGSVFSSDKITWKIRHVYAGKILDHRSFYKS